MSSDRFDKLKVFDRILGANEKFSWLFLTYISKDACVSADDLSSLLKKKGADKFKAVIEKGEVNGTIHVHVIVYSKTRFHLRNLNGFDCRGKVMDTAPAQWSMIHPNICSFDRKDLLNVMRYIDGSIHKGTEDYTSGNFELEEKTYKLSSAPQLTINNKTRTYDVTAIIALANNRKEAYAMVGKSCAVGAWNGTKSVIDTEFSMRETEENKSFMKDYLYPSTEYNYPTELSRLFDEVFLKDIKMYRYFLTIIVSKSGKGKSSAMNALGPHMYFREMVSWKNLYHGLPKEAKYILFDEIKPDHLEQLRHKKSLLCGMHGGFDLEIKYANTEHVEINIPSIILCNELPVWVNEPYWKDNTFIIHQHSSMVKADNDEMDYEIINKPTVRIRPVKGYEVNPEVMNFESMEAPRSNYREKIDAFKENRDMRSKVRR